MSFLSPEVNQIRQSIIDIDDSYNNAWDIIAELTQNAVDAIKKSITGGEIQILIDSINKSIKIKDNGVGISPNDLPVLLRPFSTNKRNDSITIGEKGVGLTFVMFSSNYFEITTSNNNGSSKGILKDAFNWKNSTNEELIDLEVTEIEPHIQGTTVLIKDVRNTPIFNLSFDQIKYILRSRTAIGNTDYLWFGDSKIKVTVQFIDQNGNEHIEEVPFKYFYLPKELEKSYSIDLDDFVEYAKSADRTDIEKRNKLKNKIIYKIGKYQHSDNREIKYTAFFIPKRKLWNDLSIQFNLCTEENLKDEKWLDNFSYALLNEGIYTSVKGMPTGIKIDHPTTGYAGYWSNIFILFEDKALKFDIGRKSIHGMQARIYKEYSRDIFNQFLKYITKYVSGEVRVDTQWDRDQVFAEIDTMLDLNAEGIKLQKNPKDQEASVAALFFECIGNGKISEIIPLTSGYRNKYDLYAKWGHKKVIIEFKSRLRNILKDFNDERKMFDEMNCVVCWNVSEEDQTEFNRRGIELEEISTHAWDEDENFPNSTHKLLLSGYIKPIYVVDMKKILNN
ncbi:ATP-binding protein [Pontibacter arcticus]|uniref:ATP-binding protein n=1 Tax=Pontibacter arcticus TaxID=2080288 RepID=A0A364RJ21_9BACT|nr:ATP-binding protein [Pontibacter arcticus]RAU84274.1 ATP-binding protein [Pontibacter arcticus]